MYDSHTHLNSEAMYPQRQQYIDLFVQAWGKWLVNSGASEFYNEKGIEIAKESLQKYPNLRVKATFGWHPLECVENLITKENYLQKVQELKQQYLTNKQHIVAIGEIWIDVHFPNGQETLGLQRELFALQCDLAQELNLPIVVHSRDEFDQTIDILQNYKNQTIYFHCWGYGPEEYRRLNDVFPNLFIGFCGNVTYKNAQALRDTLSIVHKSQILMETDAPYLTPQIVRGQTNHPAFIQHIYEFASAHLSIPLPQFSQQIEKNIKNLYWIW
jgi:TatD DNase family protein